MASWGYLIIYNTSFSSDYLDSIETRFYYRFLKKGQNSNFGLKAKIVFLYNFKKLKMFIFEPLDMSSKSYPYSIYLR